MFTRQHYKAIAEIIKQSTQTEPPPHPPTIRREKMIAGLVGYFADDNPLFDQSKFMTACGVA